MPKRKPAGWPKYMVAKRIRGATAYYWAPPTWAKRKGCTVSAEALGTDYGAAKRRCDDVLNPQFVAWRTGAEFAPGEVKATPGTFNWVVATYKTHNRYTDRPAKTKRSYDAALRLVSDYVLKDGRRVGDVPITSMTGGFVDALYEKLRIGPNGKTRDRTAVLCMVTAKLAWNVARRLHPRAVPILNPFADLRMQYEAKGTRPVTHGELVRFVAAADALGEPSIGTAAMLAYFWLVRQGDILNRLAWSHYRPADGVANVLHHKTGAPVDVPLYDDDGSPLWPELMRRLDQAPRRGTLIVTRDTPDRRRKEHLPWRADYFRHRVAAIREHAGIDAEVKFMGLRHGGNTEAADAGLTDAQIRALSGHKTAAMVTRYAKDTAEQRKVGARMRRDARTKGGDLSE